MGPRSRDKSDYQNAMPVDVTPFPIVFDRCESLTELVAVIVGGLEHHGPGMVDVAALVLTAWPFDDDMGQPVRERHGVQIFR